jgi:hypothetical protein
MTEITLDRLLAMARAARPKIQPRVYLHWTAGRYGQTFADYHVNIAGDGRAFAPSDDLAVYREHTWRRNSGAVGVALCCGLGASPGRDGLPTGNFPPTAAATFFL